MRRIIFWLASTATVLVLLFSYHTSLGLSTATATAAAYSGSVAGSTTTPPGTPSGSSSAGTSGSGSGSAKGTTTTGNVVYTRYGPVQVQVVTSSGSITSVRVLQYPSSDPRSQQINAEALPVLVQETLDAQSASIDMVSGATYTSDGYLRSIQSALDKAGA
ncbi:FMN-binding protein [Nocardioides jiangxiensis]|uniref:FMN-binding protein n=1 Tax=Nocardioides jiangxiensis TaxID=3064524 RepID=A0ABT9B1V7_9ACTN|nr:FMN-binding protein [Nocardioides sp. WY-20]MDO7868842.1 FMN-binding protein [Nocardioides sp. WY-20]